MNWLFGESKPAVPIKDQVRQWTRDLQRQKRGIERDAENIKREEEKVKAELKKLKGASRSAMLTLAKSILKARKARERMLESATRVNSVILSLEQAASQLRVASTISSSTTLMKNMQSLMSVPQVRQVCVAMSKEMMRAGMIEEAIDDAMAVDEDLEAEAEGEVDKVLQEIVGDVLAKGADVKRTAPAAKEKQESKVQEEEEDADLVARLAGLDTVKT